MAKPLRTVTSVLALTVVGVGFYLAFNLVWEQGMADPAKALEVARCPFGSSERLTNYVLSTGELLEEAIKTNNDFKLEPTEAAQRYQGFLMRLEELSYPSCAELLHEVIYNAFEYEARAQAVLVKGGIFSRMAYQYYHMLSIDNIYLVPFIVRMIEPPLPLNDGKLRT